MPKTDLKQTTISLSAKASPKVHQMEAEIKKSLCLMAMPYIEKKRTKNKVTYKLTLIEKIKIPF